MAKDISANVQLEGGSIEVTPDFRNLDLTSNASIHDLVPIKTRMVQSDWAETDPNEDSYIRNKPAIPDLDGYATEDWVEEQDYATEQHVKGTTDAIADAFPSNSASGSVVAFTTDAELPLKELTVEINPVQDLHGYNSPWPAGGGTNVWDEEWETGSLVNGAPVADSSRIRSKNYSACVPNNTYYKHSNSGNVINIFWYDSAKTFIRYNTASGGNAVTAPQNAYFFKICTTTAYGGTYKDDISINYPSTVTTYSPYSNICPISGRTAANATRCGKNLLDVTKFEPLSRTTVNEVDANTGKIAFTVTASFYGVRMRIPIQKFAGTKLAFSAVWPSTTKRAEIRTFDANETVLSQPNLSANGIINIPANAVTLQITLSNSNTTNTQIVYDNMQLEVAESVSTFESYNGTPITIDFGQTVYGGTIDVVSGLLTIDRALLDMSIASWDLRDATHRAFTFDIQNLIKIPSSQALTSGSIAEKYTEIRASASLSLGEYAIMQTGVIALYYDGVNAPSGKLVYPLAMPIEIQLTHHEIRSILGYNLVYSDVGDVDLTYREGVREWVEAQDYSTEQYVDDSIDVLEAKHDADISAVSEKLLTAFPTDNASGAVASFPDGAELPLKALTVNIEPVQDLNGYDNPWPAGGGKNVANISDATGITTQTTLGTVTLPAGDWTLSAYITNSGSASVALGITTLENVTIKTTTYVASAQTRVYGSFTLTEATECKVMAVGSASGYNGSVANVQIESGTSMTDYAHYSNICPISGWSEANVVCDGRNLWGGEITDSSLGKRVIGYSATGGLPKLNKCIIPNTYTISVVCNLPSGVAQESWARSYNIRVWFKSAIDGKWYEFPEGNTSELRSATSLGSKLFVYTSSPNISVTPTKFVSKPFELTIPVSCVALGCYKSGNYLEYTSIQLEIGNTASDIEPYHGTPITIDFGQTVYGGVLDVLSGKLTIDRQYAELLSVSGKSETDAGYFWYSTASALQIPGIASTNYKLIIDRLKANGGVSATSPEGSFTFFNTNIIRWKENGGLNLADYRAYLSDNPIHIVYGIADPIEVQLDSREVSSLLGTNTIYANTGSTDVTYRADPTLYIQRKVAEALS